MPKEKPDSQNLNANLKKLAEITDWFENQEEIDLEEGLRRIREAVKIIKDSKGRLKEIENEFEEIKKEADLKEKENE